MKKLILFLPLFALFLGCSPKVEPDYTDDFVGSWRKEKVFTNNGAEYLSVTQAFTISKVNNSTLSLFAIVTRKYNYVTPTNGVVTTTQLVTYDYNVPISNSDSFSFSRVLPVQVVSSSGVKSDQVVAISVSVVRSNGTLKLNTTLKVNNFDLGGDYVLVR